MRGPAQKGGFRCGFHPVCEACGRDIAQFAELQGVDSVVRRSAHVHQPPNPAFAHAVVPVRAVLLEPRWNAGGGRRTAPLSGTGSGPGLDRPGLVSKQHSFRVVGEEERAPVLIRGALG